ncbi:MAG: DUF4326 domain-containing protein [Synechococcaceae bacterium WB9_2_170]|nr:DUF4326 domain-containing protein [Synechococcaceae bacterium WB9_2_170]
MPSIKPERIQRRRTAGWRMPPNTIYVGRPTKWGNPFDWQNHGHADAVSLFEQHLISNPALVAAARTQLAGRHLACWCSPEKPCHADVLLSVANTTEAAQ